VRSLGAVRTVACLGPMTVLVAACGPSTAVPESAQRVHVIATDSELRLEPATITAGDVYLVLDEPLQSVVFFQRMQSESETPGPLTSDDVSRIAQGDTQGTSMEGFDNLGCDAAQRGADRGKLKVPGGCGNVFKVTLVPGSYAILTDSPEGLPPGDVPMAVLEVMP
jgi:hypothetical protein